MGFLDKVKTLVTEREGQIRSAKDKAGKFVDEKTGGKYHDKIAKVDEKADQAIKKAKDGPGPDTTGGAHGGDAPTAP